MSLVSCRDCRHLVSDRAEKCDQCGASWPGQPQASYPLMLSSTWLHFNDRIWQVPSIGVAIGAAALYAANDVAMANSGGSLLDGKEHPVAAGVLLVAASILMALSFALVKYRDYQAASSPVRPPSPFGSWPQSNGWLQSVLAVTTGALMGLAIVSYAPGAGERTILLAAVLGLIAGMGLNYRCYREIARIVKEREGATYRIPGIIGWLSRLPEWTVETLHLSRRPRPSWKAVVLTVAMAFAIGVTAGTALLPTVRFVAAAILGRPLD